MLQVVVGVKANKKWVKSRKHDDLIWIHRISEYCTSIKTANICPLVIYQLVLVRTQCIHRESGINSHFPPYRKLYRSNSRVNKTGIDDLTFIWRAPV